MFVNGRFDRFDIDPFVNAFLTSTIFSLQKTPPFLDEGPSPLLFHVSFLLF